MAETISVAAAPGAPYTWSTANFAWSGASAEKSWAGAYATLFNLEVAADLLLTEHVHRTAVKRLAGTFTAADGIRRDATLQKSQGLGLSESYADLIAYFLHCLESLAVAEGSTREVGKHFPEAWGTGDRLGASFSKTFDNTLAMASLPSLGTEKRLAPEPLALGSVHRIETWLHHAESLTVQDAGLREVVCTLLESIGISETYTDLIAFLLTVAENLGLADLPVKRIEQAFSEPMAFAVTHYKKIEMNLAIALSLADTFSRATVYRRDLAEGFSVTQALANASALSIAESLSIYEQYRRRANGVVSDMVLSGVALTEEDFRAVLDAGHPPGYTPFKDFIAGDYTYRRALFRAILQTTSADRAFIDALRVTVDVPDVLDRGTAQITDAAQGASVSFTRSFQIPPEVTLTHKGGTTVAVVRIVGAVTVTGFSAVLEDAAGARLTGSLSWVAQGY